MQDPKQQLAGDLVKFYAQLVTRYSTHYKDPAVARSRAAGVLIKLLLDHAGRDSAMAARLAAQIRRSIS